MSKKFKLIVNRLNQDELSYELTIRGLNTGTVANMRKTLAGAFRLEKENVQLKFPTYPYTFEQDVEAVSKKLEDIESAVNSFVNVKDSGSYEKIYTKLVHVFGRIENMAEVEGDPSKKDFLTKTLLLMETLDEKAEKAEQTVNVPADISVLNITDSSDDPDVASPSSPLTPTRSTNPTMPNTSGGSQATTSNASALFVQNFKSTPVSKWNLTFDSDKKGLSLNAFLERVEELRLARNVTEQELFHSAVDLFAGKALVWFRAIRSSISDWPSLVKLLREEFLPPHNNEKLLSEIKKRTQNPDEPIGIYLSIMQSLFNRLTCTISEAAKVDIIKRNILPFFQTQLALIEISTIEQLRKLCKQLENTRCAVELYAPPPRRSLNTMEPDLAYVGVSDELSYCNELKDDNFSNVPTTGKAVNNHLVCFNCNKPGHKAIGCLEPHKKICYKCRKPGFTTKTCPQCNKVGRNSVSGNAHDRL